MMDEEEVDLTLSSNDDDETGIVAQPPQPQPFTPVMPFKSENQSSQSVSSAVASNNFDGDAVDDDDDEDLKPATTGGKGLWSLWTRNFKSPLLMLLDLVDNAVDAASMQQEEHGFTGRVKIYRDLYQVMPGQKYTTGLCIRNNAKAIAPLKEVLQLFISAKANSGSHSIGENGVGLKQSCAALSDLSFVLMKNGKNQFELGIIAKALQKNDGVYLPSFKFKVGDEGNTIGQQMLETFSKPKYIQVAQCISQYGRVRSRGKSSLARGVARLSEHFDDMNQKFFDNSHVFEVIVDNVMHRGMSFGSQDENDVVRDIMNELQHEIPRRYLHLRDSFQFSVGKKQLSFKYWSERLVEFTRIQIPVRSKIPWSEDFGEMTPDSYHLSIFLGFDRYRIVDPATGIKRHKECSLYVYSRACGRMVQYESDARTMLGLAAGGTDYCQALTVIIDDDKGHLPLDPTKQGIAFGNQAYGHIHKENLYAIVSCCVKFFYQYHMNKFDRKKTLLSAKIREFSSSDIPEDNLKTCSDSDLTDYGVHFIHTKDQRILVDHTFSISCEVGPDTLFKLLPDDIPSKRQQKRKAARRTTKKKRQAQKVGKSTLPDTENGRKSAKSKVAYDAASRRKQTPSNKKRKVASSKSPQKKQKLTKAPSVRRKQSTAKVSNPRSEKKQHSAETTQVPPEMKGTRSSRRETSGKPPIRYRDLDYSDEDSEENDQDDDDSTTHSEISLETDANGDVHDEGPIDLCSSSDEEDELMKEPEKHALTSAVNQNQDGSEAVAADFITMKTENRADEEGEEDEVNNVSANLSPEPPTNESGASGATEEIGTDSNKIKIESAEDEAILPNSLSNESELSNEAGEVPINSDALKIENEALKNENIDLRARVSVLGSENDSLELEIKNLRLEVEQSKRMLSVIKGRLSNGNIADHARV